MVGVEGFEPTNPLCLLNQALRFAKTQGYC